MGRKCSVGTAKRTEEIAQLWQKLLQGTHDDQMRMVEILQDVDVLHQIRLRSVLVKNIRDVFKYLYDSHKKTAQSFLESSTTEGFHVMSYQVNFASHIKLAPMVSSLHKTVLENTTKCFVTFYLVHTTLPYYN